MDVSNIIIVVVALVALGIFISYKRGKNKDKKKKSTNTPPTPTDLVVEKSAVKEVDFTEVKEFDSDAYVDDIFSSVFYSIQNDNWKIELNWEKIIFSKEKVESQYNRKLVIITFTYRFEEDRNERKRTFIIKDIVLEDKADHKTFTYKSTISDDVKIFIYKIYSDWVNESNAKKKEKTDKSLLNIKSVLGKASERGAKLDEILGGKTLN